MLIATPYPERLARLIAADRAARPVDMARIDAITRRSVSRSLRTHRSSKDILDDAWGDPTDGVPCP